MAGSRRAEIGLYTNARGMRPGLAQARTMINSFGRSVKGVFSKIGGAIGSIARTAVAAGAGGFALGAHEALEYEAALTRAAIAQGKNRDQMEAFHRQVMDVSEATGLSRDQVLGAASAYQDATGDVAGAADAMGLVAKTSMTTGVAVEDLSRVLGVFKSNLAIDPSNFESAISVLMTQGYQGKVTLRDLASEFASVAASYSHFSGGTGLAGLTDAGAAFQVIANGVGTASEGATRFEALLGNLQRNATKLRKSFGVEVYGKGGKLRNFLDIIGDLRGKGLSGEKLFAALGSKEAVGAFEELSRNWKNFIAIRDSSVNSTASADAWKAWSDSAAGQATKSFNDLKLAIARAFTPDRIEAFASGLEELGKTVDVLVTGLERIEELKNRITGNNDSNLTTPEQVAKARQTFGGSVDIAAASSTTAVNWSDPAEYNPFLDYTYNVGRAAAIGGAYGKGEADRRAAAAAAIAASRASAAAAGRGAPVPAGSAGTGSPATNATTDKVIRVLQAWSPTINLKVDGQQIATTADNAPSQRRH